MDLKRRETLMVQEPYIFGTFQWAQEQTVASIQRNMEIIHYRLAARGINPHQIDPYSPSKREVHTHLWGKVK